MKAFPLLLLPFLAALALPAAAQPATTTNSLGMEFVLIRPGTFTYGKFQPPPPVPAGGRGPNLSPAQQSALDAMQAALGDAAQAVATARTALTEASLRIPADAARLAVQADALAAAELTFAIARAVRFEQLQASAEPIARAEIPALAQQSLTAPAAGRGGRGAAATLTPADYALAAELARRDALPGFSVRIERAFYLGTHEVTQAQWTRVMGNNPSVFQGDRVSDDAGRHPVDSVTWADAQAFVRKLNELERTDAYRLPTEFEWEYAGRAGAEEDPSWNEIRQMAVIQGARAGTTAMVGTRSPNPWGLYDMLGNVWEWVEDRYNGKLFNDPVPPATGDLRVLKGASFVGDVKNAIYSTHAAGPGNGWDVGFRIVREIR